MESGTDTSAIPWPVLSELPCDVVVELPIPNFTADTLMSLSRGTVLSTQWRTNRDLPLEVNQRFLSWVELETSEENLTARLTEFVWEQQR